MILKGEGVFGRRPSVCTHDSTGTGRMIIPVCSNLMIISYSNSRATPVGLGRQCTMYYVRKVLRFTKTSRSMVSEFNLFRGIVNQILKRTFCHLLCLQNIFSTIIIKMRWFLSACLFELPKHYLKANVMKIFRKSG